MFVFCEIRNFNNILLSPISLIIACQHINQILFHSIVLYVLSGLLFLPVGAVLFEIFPYMYFKPTYIHLSLTYGIHHRYRRNLSPTSLSRYILSFSGMKTENCMISRRCRTFARGDDVLVYEKDFKAIVSTMFEIENGDLSAQNAPFRFSSDPQKLPLQPGLSEMI